MGSTPGLTEEEQDYGFDSVKDLVPRLRQGGRKQNSLKKERRFLVTLSFNRDFTMYIYRFNFFFFPKRTVLFKTNSGYTPKNKLRHHWPTKSKPLSKIKSVSQRLSISTTTTRLSQNNLNISRYQGQLINGYIYATPRNSHATTNS